MKQESEVVGTDKSPVLEIPGKTWKSLVNENLLSQSGGK